MSFPFYAIFPTQISKKYSIVLCYTQGHHHHHRHHSIAIFGTYLCAAYTNNVSSFTGTVKRHIFSQRKVQLWGGTIHPYMYKLYSYYIHCENATLANLQRRRLEEYIIIIRWQNFVQEDYEHLVCSCLLLGSRWRSYGPGTLHTIATALPSASIVTQHVQPHTCNVAK